MLYQGYMPGRIAQFLCNTSRCHWERNPAKRLVLSRHGQSEFNLQGRIGGDTGLTEVKDMHGLKLVDCGLNDDDESEDDKNGEVGSQGYEWMCDRATMMVL